MQDLNFEDIQNYVRERLLEEPYMRRLRNDDRVSVDRIIRDTSQKADGIFLWAAFAVQDLLRGVNMLDPLEVLQNRLHHLGGSLEDIFWDQVQAIDVVHRHQAATHLDFVKTWVTREEGILRVPHVAFCLYPELVELMELAIENELEFNGVVSTFSQKVEQLTSALMWQSAGLLDIKVNKCVTPHQELNLFKNVCNHKMRCTDTTKSTALSRIFSHYYFHTSIDFIHRSVIEFLWSDQRAKEFMSQSRFMHDNMDQIVFQGRRAVTHMHLHLEIEQYRILAPCLTGKSHF